MPDQILAQATEKMAVSDILAVRGNTHGNFTDNSHVAQRIKEIMHKTPSWEGMTPYQREAVHMIAHKLGRIAHGDPHFRDHWADIAGYAELVAKRLA